MRFGPYLAFITLWSLVVYAPVAHWVWGGGWIAKLGALDFAGGTVVHVNAAAAALVCALVVGSRKDYARQAILPQNVPFTLLGAGLLWLGWFGFNAGSALAANGTAALAFANTMLAPIATLVVWTILDLMRTGKATAIGAATGIVVGLVAITPAAGLHRTARGDRSRRHRGVPELFRAAVPAANEAGRLARRRRGARRGRDRRRAPDRRLRALNWNPGGGDGVIAGNWRQLGVQAIAVVGDADLQRRRHVRPAPRHRRRDPLRATPQEEGLGLDFAQHGEEAYSRGEGAILLLGGEGNVGSAALTARGGAA